MAQKVNSSATSYNSLLESFAFFLLSFLILFHSKTAAQEKAGTSKSAQEVRVLELGKPIERQLAGGEVHVYQVNVKQGQFLHLVVEQRGIDVVVTLFGPDGKQLTEVDSPNGTQGPEPVSVIAEVAGNYRIEVRSLEKDAAPGRYDVKLKELRKAKLEDRSRIAAERAFAEGEQLRLQGKVESLRKAIAKYEEAIPLWRVVGDRAGEAGTLNILGTVHQRLSNDSRALDYFEQALTLRRVIGDRLGEAITLSNIGSVYHRLDEKPKALEYYEQALKLQKATKDRNGEAITLNNIGAAYKDLGEKQKALEYYEQAHKLFQIVNDRGSEAIIFHNIGAIYSDLGEYKKAWDYYNQALQIKRAIGDKAGEATTLNNIGQVYDYWGEHQKALDNYNHALEIHRTVGNRVGEANTLNNIGAVYNDLGEKQKALEYYKLSLTLRQAIGDRGGEARALNNIGAVYQDLGENQQALEYYGKALVLQKTIGDREGESSTLNNIGRVYAESGESKKALDYYGQSLTFMRAVGNRIAEAATLNNIGFVYKNRGEMQKAFNYYNQALELRRTLGDRGGEATTLDNISAVYLDLGELQTALNYANQALLLRRAVGDRSGEASSLNNLGVIYGRSGEYQKVLDYYTQALALERAVGGRSAEASTLNNISASLYYLNEKQKALEYLHQALILRRAVGNRVGEATTLNDMGVAYHELGDQQKASAYFSQALLLARSVDDRAGKARAFYGLARVERERDHLNEAHTQIEAALSLIDSLRIKVADHDLRASYLASVQKYYSFYIDLLIQMHRRYPTKKHDVTALQASERAHARSLLDLLAEAQIDIRQGVDSALVTRERLLQQQINVKGERLTKLLNGKHTEEQATAAKHELETILTQYQELETQIRVSSPRYAALTQPQPLSLKEIQKRVLDNNTVLLEYALGEEHSYLWAITKKQCSIFTLPPRKEIEERVKGYLAIINSPSSPAVSIASQGKNLYDVLLKSAGKILQTKPNLIIVPDGILHYLPFEALVDSVKNNAPRYLIESINISYAPSASVLGLIKNDKRAPMQKSRRELLAFGDPIFGDETATATRDAIAPDTASVDTSAVEITERGLYEERGYKFNRLPHTAKEIEKIAAPLPVDKKMTYLRAEAKEERVKADKLSQYRILHFATHGVLDEQTPGRSSVVLTLDNDPTEDGFLQMNEIFNLELEADLVVLSACQTGKGKLLRGEGVIGMIRAFMYAGARSLLVSLWPVNDQSTVELMAKFYDYMQQGKAKNAALRQAKLDLIKGNNPALRHPYFWAPFVLMGSAR